MRHARRREMAAGMIRDILDHGTKALGHFTGQYRMWIDIAPEQHIGGHCQPPLRSVNRKRPEKPGQCIGDARMADGIRRSIRLLLTAERPRRDIHDGGGCFLRIAVEHGDVFKYIFRKITLPRVDQCLQPRDFQIRLGNGSSNGMPPRLAVRQAFESFPPPLQADMTHHRLGNVFRDTGNFQIEGIKRNKRQALRHRREEQRQETVVIVPSNLVEARFHADAHCFIGHA